MKKFSALFLVLLIGVILSDCTYGPRDYAHMRKDKADMETGFFRVGMYSKSFLDQWGRPTKTFAIASDEFSRFMGSPSDDYTPQNPPFQSKGRYISLEGWIYKEKNVVLVFYGIKLVGWKTGKQAEEIIKKYE